MSLSEKRKVPLRGMGMESSQNPGESVPLHPDDFEAHLAWIMAKRFHEMVLKKA